MEEKKFYPNIAYNKAKRNKFLSLMILLIVFMGLMIGLMASLGQLGFAIFFGAILIMMLFLIPSALKTNPVKEGVPELTVSNRDVTVQGKTVKAIDIEKVVVTVLLNPVSKLDSENKEYIKEMAKSFPEEQCFGNVDILLKKGPNVKKNETMYLTVDDCLGALTALMNAGVKHYAIGFSLKKLYEPAAFTVTKVETKRQTLSETSAKERMKQLY